MDDDLLIRKHPPHPPDSQDPFTPVSPPRAAIVSGAVLWILIAIVVWLIVFSLPAFAADPYDISRATFWSSVGFDHATTEMLFRKYPGQVRELNPIMGQSVAQRTAVGAGIALGMDWATRWLKKKGHGRWATVLNFAASGVHLGAGVHNIRQMRP